MANDYIAGYPPVCATSDRGDGKMRITWPAYGLDPVLLAALTASHYVANVSLGTPESKAILATGGSSAAGFWIDVDETYAASTWLNTHRYSPQRQATVYYYTSFDLARAAMISANNHDNVFVWDYNTNDGRIGTGTVSQSTVVDISAWGGRANQQNGIAFSAYWGYALEGDLGACALITWQNLTLTSAAWGCATAFTQHATAGTAPGGWLFSRLVVRCIGLFFDQGGSALATPISILNCTANGGNEAASSFVQFGAGTGNTSVVRHCTVSNYTYGYNNANQVVTYTNNVAFDCTTCYLNTTNGVYSKCAATDATGSEAGLRSLTRAQLAFYNENDNGFFDGSFGILATSVLYHAGANTADTIDVKGNARHATTPSIGAYEGTVNAFGLTYPAQPAISVARLSDTSARVTVDGDSGVTNYVEYADFADMEWAAGGNRSGDGAVDITGLTSGHTYLIAAYSLHTSGGISEWSDAEIYTAGPASGAVGTYAKFFEAVRNTIRDSAALAAKITDGLPAAHVKLGRHINVDTDSARHSAILAAGPVLYVRPGDNHWTPRSEAVALGELTVDVTICEALDQSAANDTLTALNFIDALRQELLSESDGTGGSASWAVGGGNVRISVEAPRVAATNEIHTRLRIVATVPEAE